MGLYIVPRQCKLLLQTVWDECIPAGNQDTHYFRIILNNKGAGYLLRLQYRKKGILR
jgi:hypothetical protein